MILNEFANIRNEIDKKSASLEDITDNISAALSPVQIAKFLIFLD